MARAGGEVGSLLPEAAMAVAVPVLQHVQDDDASPDAELDDSDEEQLPRVKLARKKHKKRDVETCAWAQLLRDEDLKDSTTKTAKQFRQDFRIPYPFSLRLVELVKTKDWFATAQYDAFG